MSEDRSPKKRITLYVGEESYAKLQMYALTNKTSVSELVDGWIDSFLLKGVLPSEGLTSVGKISVVSHPIGEIPIEKPKVTFTSPQSMPKIYAPAIKADKNAYCPHHIIKGGNCRACPGGIAK